LQEIIKPKNAAAGYARSNIFGFYMDHFFLVVPLAINRKIRNQFFCGAASPRRKKKLIATLLE
jgi:hypothetical protein